MPAAAPALHCLTRTLLQADVIIRELRSAAIDGYSLITSARCTCHHSAGIGPVGTFLAKSGIDEMAAIDLPQAGRCVIGGAILPILFGIANASKHACIPEALGELGMSATDAKHCATMIAEGWTLIHVPVPTQRALIRCERIFVNAGAASSVPAPDAWISAVRPGRRAHAAAHPAHPAHPTGPAILAEAAW